MPLDHIEDLRYQARYSRQRRDIYKAKSYGSRPTSQARMNELERELARADERLKAALAAQHG